MTHAVKQLTLALFLLLIGIAASRGQTGVPIPKAPGQQCPPGYSSGASYCTPMPGSTFCIRKVGQCPSNMTSTAHYCCSK